jgi:peroxiredoxin
MESGRASCRAQILFSGCGLLSWYLVRILQYLPPWAARKSIAISDANAALIAVSPEAAPVSVDDAGAAGSTFPILIDHGGKIAEQFGLTFEMDDVAKGFLKDVGIDLEKRNGDGRWILPVPGTFVIDRSGHIAYAHVDADYRNRPEPLDIVAICRSLRS